MYPEKINSIEMLGQYVSFIRTTIGIESENTYLVLGAHGPEFFIELASGPLLEREIHMTILVEFGDVKLDFEEILKALNNKTEIFLHIPDSAHLIGLLRLLENAFNCKTSILHPLDNRGNYFPGWRNAVIAVSETLS